MHIVRHQPVASSALLRRNVHAHPRIGQRHTGRCARASQLERARSPHTQFCSVADCYSVSERHLHTQGCFSVKASKLALRREVFPYDYFICDFFAFWRKFKTKIQVKLNFVQFFKGFDWPCTGPDPQYGPPKWPVRQNKIQVNQWKKHFLSELGLE